MTTRIDKPRKGIWGRLKKYFLAGVLVTAPAFITVYLAIAIINIADRWVKSLIPAKYFPEIRVLGIPGVGLACMLIFLVLVGFFAAGWLGNFFISLADRFFASTPVLSSLYSTLKQLFHTFLGDNTDAFRKVVLLEFPHKDCWSIGFVTGNCSERPEGVDEEMIYVFVPTTPNPTNGFLVLKPKSSLRDSTMTVEQGLKAVVSMGITK